MLDIIAQPVEKDACMMPSEHDPVAGPPNARIPTRNRRRAMDWSLALASQGIEAVIENRPETGWSLVVAAAESERALAVIEQYRRENLGWLWRRTVMRGDVVFDWASVLWVLLTGAFFWLDASVSDLRPLGIMDGGAVARGEWWRFFTAEVLHADFGHLATNAVFGLLLLGFAMGRFGTGVGLLAAYLAGAAGNGVSLLIHGKSLHGLGASGVVMGALGLLAVQSVGLLRRNPHSWKFALAGLAGGVMLFVLLGLNPGTDVAAHFGGFLAGVILGAALAPARKLTGRPLVNLIAALLLAALVIVPWLLAFRTAGRS